VERAFDHAQLDWKKFVKFDKRYMRPAEVDLLIGDATKARKVLGWKPKVKFDELVTMMVDADMADVARRVSGDNSVETAL
jgi:GDPmannose 4,6-dehydratase